MNQKWKLIEIVKKVGKNLDAKISDQFIDKLWFNKWNENQGGILDEILNNSVLHDWIPSMLNQNQGQKPFVLTLKLNFICLAASRLY